MNTHIGRHRRTLQLSATLAAMLAGISTVGGAVTNEPPAAEPAAPAKAAPAGPAITSIVDRVQQARIEATIKSLPIARAPSPDAAHISGLLETQKLLIKQLTELGYKPMTQTVPYSKRAAGAEPADATEPPANEPKPEWLNIWVDIPGSTLPQEVVLVGAHFDAVPQAPGADDNGSGTAVVMELAHALKDTKPSRTIRLMFFNLEEGGLFGSRHYALVWKEGSKEHKESIVGMLSLDTIGYFSSEPKSQKNPFKGVPGFADLDVGDFLAICGSSAHRGFIGALASSMQSADDRCKTLPIDVFPNNIMPFIPPDLLRSDHQTFIALGIPAVMVTDTANFRNPHYHKPTDTLETLDLERLYHAGRAIAGSTAILAGVDPASMPTTAALTTKHPPVVLPMPKAKAPAGDSPTKPDDKPSKEPVK